MYKYTHTHTHTRAHSLLVSFGPLYLNFNGDILLDLFFIYILNLYLDPDFWKIHRFFLDLFFFFLTPAEKCVQ